MDIAEYGLSENDLRFLKEKLDNSELIVVTGNRATTGELCSYTPASGYTFYHISSSIITATTTTSTSTSILVSVQNDGSTVDYMGGSSAQSTTIGTNPVKNESKAPQKLIGDGAKKFKLNVDSITNLTIYGTIIGYIEVS